MCVESCFAARTSDKLTVYCFLCNKKFNMKCFDLTAQHTLKVLSSASNAIFMCHKCIDRTTKLKQNSRKSSDASTDANTIKSKETAMTNLTNTNGEEENKSTMMNILSMLRTVDENFTKLNSSNEEFKERITNINKVNPCDIMNELSTINLNLVNLHAKIDHNTIARSEFENRNVSSILEKLNEIYNKSNVSSMTTTSKPNTIASHNSSKTHYRNVLDPLNWSFSFNQSVMANENNELYQLLHGFEQNTWTSFDYLCRKLSENTDAIIHIETACKEFNAKNGAQMSSPLLDSITLDNLQIIKDKCDQIEKNLLELDSNIKSLHLESDMNEELTQKLRDQFLKLVDNNPEENRVEQQQNTDTNCDLNVLGSTDDLTRHSVVNDNASNNSRPLDPQNKFAFYVTKFAPNTTSEMILDYMCKNGVTDIDSTKVTSLIPRNKDRSTINFISFKIDTNATVAKVITSTAFWPNKCIIKDFVHKSIVDLTKGKTQNNANFFRNPPAQLNQR